MGIYLSIPKTEKFCEDGENSRVRYGLSSMQGWRATMEDAHAAFPDLDASTSFFGVYDGHGGTVVAKFCAKYLHHQVLKSESYSAGDLATSLQKAFFRDCMSSQQLVDFIHEQLSMETKLSVVCERVLDSCLAPSTAGGEGCDNMTMILVQFKKQVPPAATTAQQQIRNEHHLQQPSSSDTAG